MPPTSLLRYSRRIFQFKLPSSETKLLHAPPHFSSHTRLENADSCKPGPPPIRVSRTESAGRGVFAARKIFAGDLIHTAEPLLAHPSLSAVHHVCCFCLGKVENDHASEAQSASFCSEKCKQLSEAFHDVEMKADWSDYYNYCRSRGLKYPLLVKRLACMVISGAVSAGLVDILQPSSLSSNMILEMEEGYNLLRTALVKAKIIDELMLFLTRGWYIGVLARIRINAFRIELVGGYEDLLSSAAARVEAEVAVGNAVYMLPSFYNHDCDPNAHIIWINNAKARLQALRDVEPDEELRICYIDASMEYEARQMLLSQGFGFLCKCDRCSIGD